MAFFGYLPANYGYSSSPEWVRSLAMLLILVVMLGTGLLAALGREGTDLSPDNRYYRRYFGLLGLRLGRWQLLPPVVGITLKFYSEVARGNAGNGPSSWGIWDTAGVRYRKLVLLLSLQGSATGLVVGEFSTDNLEAARQAAQALAGRFGVPVREYLVPQRTRRR